MNELAQPFADLADQLEFVTAERDRLRDAVEILRGEIKQLRDKIIRLEIERDWNQ